MARLLSSLRVGLGLALALASAGTAPAQATLELVPLGSTWSYLDTGVDPGPGWADAAFDDSAWASGPAQLGYGEGDEVTLVDFGADPLNRHVTTWFRTTFDLADPSPWRSLRLELLRDDGLAVYLNGQLLRRDRLPWVGWDADTLADGASDGAEESVLHAFDQPAAALVAGTNVLAVELHQASEASEDLSFDLRLVARKAPALLRGPYLQPDSPTSMRLRWTTSEPVASMARFGPEPGIAVGVAFDDQPKLEHNLLLTGLDPDTSYFYDLGAVLGKPLPGRQYRFRTPPPTGQGERVNLWVIGDSGTGNTGARAVRDGFLTSDGEDPDLWILLGDNAYPGGSPAAYQRALFDMYPGILCRTPLVSTRGNHEQDEPYYYDILDLPGHGGLGGVPSGSEAYYSFQWGPVHFVCLDSYGSSRLAGDPMHTWLQADLAAADAEWLVAFWHHAPYSRGTHDSDLGQREAELRQNFLPLLEAAGVDLVLAGHSHGYERSFLIDGHYGLSSSFDPASMGLDLGDGQVGWDGAYTKARGAHRGAVYSVAGNAGDVRNADYDHPVMVISGPILGSLRIQVDGDRLDYALVGTDGQVEDSFTLLHDTYLDTYCEPTPHTGGCGVTVSWEGYPSLSGASPFLVHGDNVLGDAFGFFLYGEAPTTLPLFEGTLCVASPFQRQAPVSAGGSGACGGRLTEDFGAHLASGADPSLAAGRTLYGQFWYRDALSPTGANFSQALAFVLRP